jgi:hypothetical protein
MWSVFNEVQGISISLPQCFITHRRYCIVSFEKNERLTGRWVSVSGSYLTEPPLTLNCRRNGSLSREEWENYKTTMLRDVSTRNWHALWRQEYRETYRIINYRYILYFLYHSVYYHISLSGRLSLILNLFNNSFHSCIDYVAFGGGVICEWPFWKHMVRIGRGLFQYFIL